MKRLLIIAALSLFSLGANATLPIWYQAAGVVTTEQSEIGTADFYSMNQKYYDTATKCTNAISAQNDLLTASGAETPWNGKKVFQKAAGVCHAVLPYQMAGYVARGTAIVQQVDRQSKRFDIEIGPFADKAECDGAIITQNSLALQNTPITGRNVGYKVFATCRFEW